MIIRHKILIPALAIAIPSIISLLIAEVTLRMIGFQSPVMHAEMFSWSSRDPLLPFGLRPGYSGYFGGSAVTVGADGNRIVPVPAGVDASALEGELVILGDSVVFGLSLNDTDTIGANIQTSLVSNHSLRVVSIAVPGYSSWNEYAALKGYSNLVRVRTVVVVYVPNDVTTDNDFFKFQEHDGKIRYMERDILRKITRVLYDHSRLAFFISDSIKRIAPIFSRKHALDPSDVDKAALSYSMEAIKRMSDLCRERGIKFFVAIYRDGAFYGQREKVARYERELGHALKDAGVNYFTLKLATERLTKGQFAVAWNDDSHPSPAASKLMAEEIVQELQKNAY
jgi:hypothetical protein